MSALLMSTSATVAAQPARMFDLAALERTLRDSEPGWTCSKLLGGDGVSRDDAPRGVYSSVHCANGPRRIHGSVFEGATVADGEASLRRHLSMLSINYSVPVGGLGEEAWMDVSSGSAWVMYRQERVFVYLIAAVGTDRADTSARATAEARQLVRQSGRAVAAQFPLTPVLTAASPTTPRCAIRVGKESFARGEPIEFLYVFSNPGGLRVLRSVRMEEEYGSALRLRRADGTIWRFMRGPLSRHLLVDFSTERLPDGEPSYRFSFPPRDVAVRLVSDETWIDGWAARDSATRAVVQTVFDGGLTAIPPGHYVVWADFHYDLPMAAGDAPPGTLPTRLIGMKLNVRCAATGIEVR